MDYMEQLLCPQISMDVEDTPLEIQAPSNEPEVSPEADISTLPIELRTRLILDNQYTFAPEQIPHDLLPNEEQVVNDLHFSAENHLKEAKLHCTVCNRHLGTSLVEQMSRYIHPVLNTLMCKYCFQFYGTGEFSKDEDGSEIYCKWCGQGGTVMCCSDCPLVFCQKCVTKNLGIHKLRSIRDSENWSCFKCEPSQLSKFHIASHVLHEYNVETMKIAISSKNMLMVREDISTCCKRKRRRNHDSDDENDEFLPEKLLPKQKSKPSAAPTINNDIIKAPAPAIVKRALTTLNTEPLTAQNNLFQSLQLQTAYAVPNPQPVLKFQVANIQRNSTTDPTIPTLAELMPSLFNSMAAQQQQQPIRLHYVPIRSAPKSTLPVVNPKPIVKSTWLINSVVAAKAQAQVLIKEADAVQKAINSSKNYADLANLHNKLQRAMASCTNMLIQTRRDMHKDFLKYLQTNNVSHSTAPTSISTSKSASAGTAQAKALVQKPKNSNNINLVSKSYVTKVKKSAKVVTAPIDLCDDDDEVHVVEGNAPALNLCDNDPLAISDEEEDSMVSNHFSFKPEKTLVAPTTKETVQAAPVLDLTDEVPAVSSKTETVQTETAKENGNIFEDNSKVKYDTSELTVKEFQRAISVTVALTRENFDTSTISGNKDQASYSQETEPVIDDNNESGTSSGFDFVREMQNEIQSVTVRATSSPDGDIPRTFSPSITTDVTPVAKKDADKPGVDVVLEAIKQLTETITESKLSEDVDQVDMDSNDNLKCQETPKDLEENAVAAPLDNLLPESSITPTSNENNSNTCVEDGTNNESDALMPFAAEDVTPPAICLEDMVKIYDACNTVDGDMVPAD